MNWLAVIHETARTAPITRRWHLMVLAGCFWLCTLPAHAERALLMPSTGDPALSKLRKLAEERVVELLPTLGCEVVRYRDATRARASASDCPTIECAPRLLSDLHADVAVVTSLWKHQLVATSERGTPQPEVVVTLVDRRGAHYPAEILVDGNHAAQAAEAALLQALSLRLLGAGPWLDVRGEPEGAQVSIDGKPLGRVPYRAAVSPGAHTLRIAANGYAIHEQPLEIPISTTHMTKVDIHLDPAPAETDSSTSPETLPNPPPAIEPEPAAPRLDMRNGRGAQRQPSSANMWIGSVLLAGAVAAAVDPIRNAVRSGDCLGDQDARGRCGKQVYFGPRSIGLTAVAGAALLGAGYFFIFRPIRVAVEAQPDRAMVHVATDLSP
jgi:hypothetical protein